ncbi:MAG: transcriptional regulator [Burkholderiaceae bacterium]|nr:MAG: transcriptional regulator [Burkholderiaceae bacterium]TBR77637.1 MAG: transcriptional regulator [Burkholderiaceae bacterium]
MNDMTASQLQAFLRQHYPKENERFEWKEWASLRSNVSGRKGEDLVSYVSALANMDGGCLVIGVRDRTLEITGIRDFADYTPENVVHRILGKTPNLPSMGLRVEVLRTSDTAATVWLVHVPRHSPRQPVYAHDKAWQRDGDSLTELRTDRHQAILSEALSGQDWSAVPVPGATLDDLDSQALQLARKQFAAKNSQERWASDIGQWTDTEFLDRARLGANGILTRAALLLLGKPESTHKLQHPAEMVWRLLDERAVRHFHPPFLLASSELLRQVRNPNIKLFPATSLLAVELPKYETRVILEALHNCIAHQDYERGERVVVEESINRLEFQSAGAFFDGEATDYAVTSKVPGSYRNPWLANAMRSIGMIDSAGFGIREMFQEQRKRFLPLPDYEKSTPSHVVLTIYGQQLDENYSRMLMESTDLPIEQVVWLDRVQKKERIADEQAALLRRKGLITGRKPNLIVSAAVATFTKTENQYVLNKGMDDDYYKRAIVSRLKLGPASGDQLRQLVIDKLPAVLTPKEKETKVKNLRTALRLRGLEGTFIEVSPSGPARGSGAIWRIKI